MQRMGMVPPSYVRSVTFINKTGKQLTAVTEHDSKEQLTSVCKADEESVLVDKGLDQGTWTKVDPVVSIVSVEVEGVAQKVTSFPELKAVGVVQHRFTVELVDGAVQVTQS